MPLHQDRDVSVFDAANEIAFPMAGDDAALDFCGPFPDGDGIYDLTARTFKDSGSAAQSRTLLVAGLQSHNEIGGHKRISQHLSIFCKEIDRG